MFRLIALIALVLLFLAFRYLPWWVLLGCVVLILLLWRFVFGWVLGSLFMAPLRNMGKVLRDATVDVHSVRPTEPPATASSAPELGRLETTHLDESEFLAVAERADAHPEPDVPRNWFEIDITVTPRPSSEGKFPYWDMEGLQLIKPGSSLKDEDDSCQVKSVQPIREGVVLLDPGQTDATAEQEDYCKVTGPHRLKMVIGVKPDVRELVFRYFFETFGKVVLPDARRPPSPGAISV